MLKKDCVSYLNTEVIMLIGFSGVGKSFWGAYIARTLGRSFYDSDSEIEKREKMSVSDVFAQYGEVYFRQQEYAVLSELVTYRPCVIATGGGAIEHQKFHILTHNVHVWFLNETREIIESRLDTTAVVARPLWNDRVQLWDRRYPLYMQYADFVSHADEMSIIGHVRELQSHV